MAEELLKLYAARKAVAGHAFSPDSHWQEEFGDAFEYDLTADQQTAIADITRDIESPTPMDRLLCGDVGYGKTEVAMRAAFKAVIDGKQVAFLAPTTVLAFQHLRTLRERFAGFPVQIDMISRFRTKQEQKDIVAELAGGQVDIIVGTHRLLSKDVQFRDLGLLVVDEEQRFGVAHKERIKQLRKKVDVLTMTATPIPRTLNMSLVGIRDMSVIETPPRDRLAIQTQVVKFETDVIARAIRTEIERGGQVYFVHNRVESIYSMANLVSRLVPEAKLAVGHGQMGEDELETRDGRLRRAQVRRAAGDDDRRERPRHPERQHDHHQSRRSLRAGAAVSAARPRRPIGSPRVRVPADSGRSRRCRRSRGERLAAIREFSDLGSGFRIAALDLEIRGAGNLLGGEQSGHIEAVGFDMYMKLLEETIRELKGEDLEDERRAAVNLRLDLRIDESYIPDMNQRLSAYRRMASARTLDEVDRFRGRAARSVRCRRRRPSSTWRSTRAIRLMADRIGLESLDREGHDGRPQVPAGREDRSDDAPAAHSESRRPDAAAAGGHPDGYDQDLEASASADPRSDRRRGHIRGRHRRSQACGTDRAAADDPGPSSWWTARATSETAPASRGTRFWPKRPRIRPRRAGCSSGWARLLDQLSQIAGGKLKY